MPFEELRERISTHAGCVVLGYTDDCRAYFWLVPFTATALEEWWRQQETFEQGNEVTRVLADIFAEPLKKFRTEEIPGEMLWAEDDASNQLWDEMSDSATHYKARLCCDSDSYLKAPDGRSIFHRGCTCPDAAAEDARRRV